MLPVIIILMSFLLIIILVPKAINYISKNQSDAYKKHIILLVLLIILMSILISINWFQHYK